MQFEHPGWLLLLVLLAPVLWWSRGARVSLGPIRGVVVPALRCMLVTALVLALADPVMLRSSNDLTVAVVLDRSRSIAESELNDAVSWLQEATLVRGESDRLAVIHAAREAAVVVMPDAHGQVGIESVQGRTDGSDLAGAVEFAKGLLPEAGAHRLLLVSDGNETIGSLLEAADRAAEAGIPIDVLPVRYERGGEVMVERLLAPSDIRPGDAVDLRVVLRSQSSAKGRLVLFRNGTPISVAGGAGLELTLDPGLTVIPLTVPAAGGSMQRYEAVFEPAAGSGDARSTNNRAAAVSLHAGQGRVLLVSEGSQGADRLAGLLNGRGLAVEVGGVESIIGGPAALAAWDAIALVNLPRWSLPDHVDGELASWVRDGGGGLLMTGGPTAFGAGGWIGSQVAEILPVGLDPPAERQLRRGALAIILHSCEMPRGNYWGRKVAEASIEALSSLDYVGIVEFENRSGGTEWAFPMQVAGDKRAALHAAASLKYGDMPSFRTAMQRALQGLKGVSAGQKHVIIISDGDPQPPPPALLDRYVAAKVSVSTVMVGGHGTAVDRRRMQAIATVTGGRFHDVQSPSQLPGIFIQEAQVVSRSLVQEGTYAPQWQGPGGGPLPSNAIDAIGALPEIGGYVLTEPRGGLARDAIAIPTEHADDPLFAWSHQGLGRVVAFTSDLGARWADGWAGWEGEVPLWERTVSWLTRPRDDGALALSLQEGEDGDVVVDIEARDSDAGFLNFLQTQAAVMGPGGVSAPLNLKQTGPGQYRGSFRMGDVGGSEHSTGGGGWVVGVRYRGTRPGSGDPVDGWVQGAVVQNWPDEDRAVRSNEAILAQVAQRSGGRVFSIDEDPSLVRVFEREGLPSVAGHRTIWGVLSMLAAVLLLIDIAVRRIVPDAHRRQTLARRAAGLGDAAAGSASVAWKQVKAKAAARRTARRSEPAANPTPPSPPKENGTSPSEDEVHDESTMSRLRAVRKRLRDQEDEP